MLEFIKAMGPIIVGLAGLYLGYRYNERSLTQKSHEDERKEIYKKLNSFYGPVRQLLGLSFEFYEVLKLSRSEDFRTLLFLLDGNTFQGNDKVVLQQILDVGQNIEQLIQEQSGLVEDKDLYELLWKLRTHIRVIQLAAKGDLQGEKEKFKKHVFPRPVTDKIEQEILRLNARLAELNAI
jgi:hypothetical protein